MHSTYVYVFATIQTIFDSWY